MKKCRWKILRSAPSKRRPSGGTIQQVVAQCECGTVRTLLLPNLTSGKSLSCGCFRRKRTGETKVTHGDARKGNIAVEYSCWQSMLKRCTRPSYPQYADYGGRGITVCSRWLKYENFLADMGRKPSPRHSLDRFPDNDGNYEPDNCRWALPKAQRLNQRKRARLDQFTDAELVGELTRRGYSNSMRVEQFRKESFPILPQAGA